jgi:SET domain-containing protein
MSLIIRSSAIHAAGCYTTAPISAGARVIEYTGLVVDEEQGNRLYEGKDYTYLFALEDGRHYVDGYGMAMYINHSCDPNCETEEAGGRIWIRAARDIAPGEELTYDYNLFDGSGAARCSCGARHCRGTMYSPEEIRKRKRQAARRKRRGETGARKARKPAA